MIDAHAHLTTDDPAYPSLVPVADPMTAERLLSALDAHGLSAAVAVQRAHVFGFDNRYVVDAARRHPGRLAAMCVVDGLAPDAATTVRRWASLGARAMRLTAPGGGRHGGPPGAGWFAGPEAAAVWRTAADLGLSMCLHLYRWNRDECLRALPAVLRVFPDVPVVLDHVASVETGGPRPYPGADLLLALADHPRVHVKATTLNPGLDPAGAVTWLVGAFGAERVLWGSDVTQTPVAYPEMVRIGRASVSGLPAADAAQVLAGTAARLYGLAP